MTRPLAFRDGFVQHPGESVRIAQFPMSGGIIAVRLQSIPQQRYSLFNFSGVYQEIREEDLCIQQVWLYRQSPFVGGLGAAILFTATKFECRIRIV